MLDRERIGREPSPSAAVLDSRNLKTSESGGLRSAIRVNHDPGRADPVAIDDQSHRDELERHIAMRDAILPSLSEAVT